ncbi:hypothetical protein D3C85_1002390 [compost metagenome]
MRTVDRGVHQVRDARSCWDNSVVRKRSDGGNPQVEPQTGRFLLQIVDCRLRYVPEIPAADDSDERRKSRQEIRHALHGDAGPVQRELPALRFNQRSSIQHQPNDIGAFHEGEAVCSVGVNERR